MTYIVIVDNDSRYHFYYLSLVLDAYSKEIVGWSVNLTLNPTYPIEVLKMALTCIKSFTKFKLRAHTLRIHRPQIISRQAIEVA